MIAGHVENPESTSLYTLELSSRLDSLIQVENFIDELKDQYELSDTVYANIMTCLSETVNNAVVHGNKGDLSKKVLLKLEVQENNLLVFTITDEGRGFNYKELPDPTDPENLENLTGRGIYIVKHLADACNFNSTGNAVELHFNIK